MSYEMIVKVMFRRPKCLKYGQMNPVPVRHIAGAKLHCGVSDGYIPVSKSDCRISYPSWCESSSSWFFLVPMLAEVLVICPNCHLLVGVVQNLLDLYYEKPFLRAYCGCLRRPVRCNKISSSQNFFLLLSGTTKKFLDAYLKRTTSSALGLNDLHQKPSKSSCQDIVLVDVDCILRTISVIILREPS